MDPKLPPNTIYTDLDSVLDTRLGLIRQYHPELMSCFEKPGYWERDCNEWETFTEGALSRHDFYQLWLKRDHVTLEHSYVSNIVHHIYNCIQAYIADAAVLDDIRPSSVFVNTAPYQLTEEECTAFGDLLAGYFKEFKTVVTVGYIPITDLTPEYVLNHYIMITSYLGEEWLGKHHTAITTEKRGHRNILYGFPLNVPRLYTKSGASLSKKEKQRMHMEFKIVMMEFIQHDPIDALWFSEFKPDLAKPPADDTEDETLAPKRGVKSFTL